MIDKILEFALRQRVFVLLAAVALIAIGAWSASRLPIDAVPDITNVQVQINTAVPALAPEEIEKLITYPIEVEMGGIEKLLEVRSLSKFGLSQISLIFDEGTDIYRARQLTGERLQAVLDELPPGVTPKLAPITTGLGEIYHYTVHYKKDFKDAPSDPIERLRQLKLVQDYLIKPALRTVRIDVGRAGSTSILRRMRVIRRSIARSGSHFKLAVGGCSSGTVSANILPPTL